MGHRDKKRMGLWLKDLREQGYLGWIYSTDFTEKTKPATYYLELNGIRFLRTFGQCLPEELRKRYRDKDRSESFIARCLLITDCCIGLMTQAAGGTSYSMTTESDYLDPESEYQFLAELGPHLVFTKHTDGATQPYLLNVIDATLPRYRVRKLLKQYVEYLDGDEWVSKLDGPSPIALFICPAKGDMIYAKRRTRKLLEDTLAKDDVHMRFAIAGQVKTHGVAGKVWEAV